VLVVLGVANATHNVTPYSKTAATPYLMYAYSAYCNSTNIEAWNCYWCTEVAGVELTVTATFYNKSTNTFGYAGYNSQEIIISFRGTETDSLLNWITDLEFSKTVPYQNDPDVRVHSGFLHAYESVQSQVRSEANRLKSEFPGLPVTVTGHSLGAALATLCISDLIQEHPDWTMQTWNYGNPRVGNDGWASWYQTLPIINTWRSINMDDMVPHLPPEDFGFYHEPQEAWYPKNTTTWVVCSNTNGEDPTCSDSVPDRDENVDDHLDYLGFELDDGDPYGC
jgi:hypothetical protein